MPVIPPSFYNGLWRYSDTVTSSSNGYIRDLSWEEIQLKKRAEEDRRKAQAFDSMMMGGTVGSRNSKKQSGGFYLQLKAEVENWLRIIV